MKQLRELLLTGREKACDCSATSLSSRRSWNNPRRYIRSAGSLFRPSRSGCCCSSRGPREGHLCSPRPHLSLLQEEWLSITARPARLLPSQPRYDLPECRVSPLSESERSEETVDPILSILILSIPSFSSCLFRCRCSRCSWSIWCTAFLS